MNTLAAFFASHALLAWYLGLWAALATLVNTKLWPKNPKWPLWEKLLHGALVDLPSAAAAPGYKGLLGRLNIPFVTLSLSESPSTPTALLMIVIGSIGLTFCAHMTPSQKAYTDSFLACLKSKGSSAGSQVATDAWNDLNNGTNQATIYSQLEGLAGTVGVDAVGCAVTSWLNPTAAGELNPAGVAAAHQFLLAHKK